MPITLPAARSAAVSLSLLTLCGAVSATSASAFTSHHRHHNRHVRRHGTAARHEQRHSSLASRHASVRSLEAARKLAAQYPASATVPGPAGEIRAMWIVRDTLESPEKIRNAVALAKKYHFNTLFVQVRGRGDAFYHSNIEPRAEELANQPADFDPLMTAIEEGHKAGLEVHAWMDTFFVWHKARMPYSSQHVLNQHPDWVVVDRDGHTQHVEKNDCEGAFLDPAIPEVREYTKRVFLDVVEHYPVDGIHFDYVRYPNENWSFSATDLATFREWAKDKVPADQAAYADQRLNAGSRLAWYYCFPNEWRDWRRSNVMATVRAISEEAHRMRPGIIVSAAVFPNYDVAYRDKGQAWHDWLAEGLLDAACPMSYNTKTETVGAQIRDAVAHSSGKPIVAGVGAWQVSAGSAIAKGQVYRSLGASGINLFSYGDITRDGRSDAYLSKVSSGLFASPATAPDWHRTVVAAAADAANSSGSGTAKPGMAAATTVNTNNESGGQ